MTDKMGIERIAGYSAAVTRVDFSTVKRFQVDQTQSLSGVGEYVVRLTVESDQASTSRRVTLVAEGVTDLRISSWGGKETRLIGLDCIDISANQWEGKRWWVRDYEEDMIHFYCRDLRIDDVEQ